MLVFHRGFFLSFIIQNCPFMDMKNYVLEIYKVESEKYSKTREIHWKLNISIWSVLIVAIYAKATGNLSISGISLLSQIGIYTLYCLIHLVFINKIHGSINRSLQRMHSMAKYIIEGGANQITWEGFEKKTIKKNNQWEWLQIAITIFLIAIFHFIN